MTQRPYFYKTDSRIFLLLLTAHLRRTHTFQHTALSTADFASAISGPRLAVKRDTPVVQATHTTLARFHRFPLTNNLLLAADVNQLPLPRPGVGSRGQDSL